ncbi:uncharacterized protein LOC119139697 isoform X3 [Syngnathus acus]|nr:uncharacterized protein LOC119139697 isoform X3 [Syngnathus acus]
MTEAFSDPWQSYITQVTAKLRAQASWPLTHPGFKPIKDTQLDLPAVAVTPCRKNLCVDLLPQTPHLWEFYNSLSYELRIENSDAGRTPFFQEPESLKGTVLKNLAPGNYCISVRFSDSFIPRQSNYSQRHCVVTTGISTSDSVISAFLCIISIAVIIIVILLIYTGLLCLRKIHLPPVLTSVHHTKEALIVVPHKASLSSLVIRPTLYSPCEEKDRQLSDLQDGERTSRNESGYKMRLNSNLPSLSSSSPSLLFSYQPGSRLNNTSNSIFLSLDVFSPLPQTWIWNDRLLNAASKHTSTTTASLSDTLVNSDHSPFLDQASFMAERIQPIEVENWEDEKRDNQDVNLSSLILGRYVEEWDKTISDQSNVDTIDLEEHDRNSAMLPETWDTKEAHTQSTSCSDDEQQQDIQFSYMRR